MLQISILEWRAISWHMPCGIFVKIVHVRLGASGEELEGGIMKSLNNQKGAIGWILLWVLGIPIPILLLLFVVRGCT